MTEPLKVKPFAEQAAGNRHDLVASNLYALIGGSIEPWLDNPEKYFSDAADTAIRAADHSDAAMGIVRVIPGLDEHMLPLVKAVDRVLRRHGIPARLMLTERDATDDLTLLGEFVQRALTEALLELPS